MSPFLFIVIRPVHGSAAVLVLKHGIREAILESQPIERNTEDLHFPRTVQETPRGAHIQSEPQRIDATGIDGARRFMVSWALREGEPIDIIGECSVASTVLSRNLLAGNTVHPPL